MSAEMWMFLLGVSTGLAAAFLALGHLWAAALAGIPIALALLLALVVILLAWAESQDNEEWFTEDNGTGDGYRN